MIPFDSADTIYAVSSGAGKSAIAIVRVSGSQVSRIAERICRKTNFQNRRATLSTLFDENGNALDRAIVIRFMAPGSFTGEDMVEFHVVGGKAVTAGVLHALAACSSTRPAEPGEFAMRAFENGKVDLTEVEGLVAVVEAETRAQLHHAMTMATGALSRQCEGVRALLLSATAHLESLLDFSDVEDATELTIENVLPPIREADRELKQMIRGFGLSERLQDGMTVVLAGLPNVGKSTLLNHLAKRDVAIVSPTPGTTRDVLEVAADLAGFPVTFVDTAGIRTAVDPVEAEGVARAKQRGARADLVLWLFDNDELSLPTETTDWSILPVRTKADLAASAPQLSDRLAISAQTGQGIEALLARIAEFADRHFEGAGQISVGTERQLSAANDALSALSRILADPGRPVEIVAEDLRRAIQALGRIVGRIGVEDVLGEIFSRLCVGK